VRHCASLQWAYSQSHLSPSTFVGLIDVAPLLGLVPLFCCFCFALVAALQQPRGKQRSGVLHGVKSLKALCTIFTHISAWYGELRYQGPWAYEWTPPMAQLMRDWSASFILSICLDEPERIPDEADVQKAIAQAEQRRQAAPDQWQQAQQALAERLAQLDVKLAADVIKTDEVVELAAALARIAACVAL
jgi:hypothetical protein